MVLPMVGSRTEGEQSASPNRLGTAEQMRDAASARQITAGLVQAINTTDIRLAGISMTLAQLADHFHQRELGGYLLPFFEVAAPLKSR